ncbi:hypothetical protein [Pimelobacter simplex]|uniref:hypothetical protein n=1 Tax=Nocardioides simplex TaxID=2045 RepID=UPI0019325649|nr:hypothetical protein [Pimelobacter simplex]
MIRDRMDPDLDRLAAALLEVDGAADVLAGRSPLSWLTEADGAADVTWVFDQAPVSVAPTRNVVGHVQVCSADPAAPWVPEVAADAGTDPADLLVIGRLFVRPMKHERNIARYLLTECVKRIAARGRAAVLDPDGLALVPTALWQRLGFSASTAVPVLLP